MHVRAPGALLTIRATTGGAPRAETARDRCSMRTCVPPEREIGTDISGVAD